MHFVELIFKIVIICLKIARVAGYQTPADSFLATGIAMRKKGLAEPHYLSPLTKNHGQNEYFCSYNLYCTTMLGFIEAGEHL